MLTAKILPKGQITIPKKIRDRLELNKGDLVLLEERERSVILRKGNTLLDVIGTLTIDPEPSIRQLVDEARERMGDEHV